MTQAIEKAKTQLRHRARMTLDMAQCNYNAIRNMVNIIYMYMCVFYVMIRNVLFLGIQIIISLL